MQTQHRQSGRTSFKVGDPEGLVEPGPDEEIGVPQGRRDLVWLQQASPRDAAGDRIAESCLHGISRRSVPDHAQPPRQIRRQDGECPGQERIGAELVARPHHGHGDEFDRLRRPGKARDGSRGIDEGLQPNDPCGTARQTREPGGVAIGETEVHGAAPDRRFVAIVPAAPWSGGPPRRMRGLRGRIGKAEPMSEAGADQVGRLVEGVVGEPELRRRAGLGPVLRDPLDFGVGLGFDFRETHGIRCGAEAAQRRGEPDFVPAGRKRAGQEPRHGPITRGDRMVRPLQRRVEDDVQSQPGIRPNRDRPRHAGRRRGS